MHCFDLINPEYVDYDNSFREEKFVYLKLDRNKTPPYKDDICSIYKNEIDTLYDIVRIKNRFRNITYTEGYYLKFKENELIDIIAVADNKHYHGDWVREEIQCYITRWGFEDTYTIRTKHFKDIIDKM